MPTSVLDPAKRRHPLLDGHYPEAALYLQHQDGRWGRYVRTVRGGAKVTFPNGALRAYWVHAAVCASVVTPKKIW